VEILFGRKQLQVERVRGTDDSQRKLYYKSGKFHGVVEFGMRSKFRGGRRSGNVQQPTKKRVAENCSNVMHCTIPNRKRSPELQLYNRCKKVKGDDMESWNELRELINECKTNAALFNTAVCNQGDEYMDNGRTLLHILLEKKPPADVISTLIRYSPNAIEIKNKCGELPIHTASRYGASVEVLNLSLQAYPAGLAVKDNFGSLPLHNLCKFGSSPEAVDLLINVYPGAVRVSDLENCLPIHLACARQTNLNLKVLNHLLMAYPESIGEKSIHGRPSTMLNKYCRGILKAKDDEHGRTLLHYAHDRYFSSHLVQLLTEAVPESLEVEDKYYKKAAFYSEKLISQDEIMESSFLRYIYGEDLSARACSTGPETESNLLESSHEEAANENSQSTLEETPVEKDRASANPLHQNTDPRATPISEHKQRVKEELMKMKDVVIKSMSDSEELIKRMKAMESRANIVNTNILHLKLDMSKIEEEINVMKIEKKKWSDVLNSLTKLTVAENQNSIGVASENDASHKLSETLSLGATQIDVAAENIPRNFNNMHNEHELIKLGLKIDDNSLGLKKMQKTIMERESQITMIESAISTLKSEISSILPKMKEMRLEKKKLDDILKFHLNISVSAQEIDRDVGSFSDSASLYSPRIEDTPSSVHVTQSEEALDTMMPRIDRSRRVPGDLMTLINNTASDLARAEECVKEIDRKLITFKSDASYLNSKMSSSLIDVEELKLDVEEDIDMLNCFFNV